MELVKGPYYDIVTLDVAPLYSDEAALRCEYRGRFILSEEYPSYVVFRRSDTDAHEALRLERARIDSGNVIVKAATDGLPYRPL